MTAPLPAAGVTDSATLRAHFSKFGEITDCYIPEDLYTKIQKVCPRVSVTPCGF